MAREPTTTEIARIAASPITTDPKARLPCWESAPRKSAVTAVIGVQVLEAMPSAAVGSAAISAIRDAVRTRAAAAQSEGTRPATSFLFLTFRQYSRGVARNRWW